MTDITRTVLLEGGTEALHLRAFRLTVTVAGETVSQVFTRRRVTIGSKEPADFVIEDARVSRMHAAIEVDAKGYRLLDTGSKNGVFVGELMVQSVYLRPGTAFLVGQVSVQFEVTNEEVEVRFSQRNRFGNMLGQSLSMREIFALLERVSPSDLTILVEGKSGTGKELVAEAVHKHSSRHRGPFVVFDCSAVSSDLIESELFGHVKGAFTGAVASRKGAFENAQGGTLFIDELGELGLDVQPKLLRALERREIRRVGSNEAVSIDVRIVAATNRSLHDEVARGTFREDLYYRFAVLKVVLPALQERVEDIPLLVEHFLQDATARTGRSGLGVSYATMERLKAYAWPGNVRELRNFIERAVVLANDTGQVDARFLQPLVSDSPTEPPVIAEQALTAAGVPIDLPFKDAKNQLIERFEVMYWQRLMEQTEGNITQAARIAGIHRKSVEYILKKLGLERSIFIDS
jgi:DNA-binding NtrC family response regulator